MVNQLAAHTNIIIHMDSTSNGNFLSCSYDKSVKFWKTEKGELLKSIQFKHEINCVEMLNDNLIAVGVRNQSKKNEGEIIFYNLSKSIIVKIISAHSSNVNRLRLLPNGDMLSGSSNGEIKLWKIFDK